MKKRKYGNRATYAKVTWKIPEIRQRRIKGISDAFTKERKNRHSKILKKLWKSSVYRERQSIARKDWDFARFRNHKHKQESKEKTSQSVKVYAKNHPEKFKKSEEHKRKLREQHLGLRPSKESRKKMSLHSAMKNPKYRKKWFKSIHYKPNKQEQKITSWINEASLPFVYTGDGMFFVGWKNPDWKHKFLPKLIEFNGFFTHTKQEEIDRKRYFKERGFKVLFLHYLDLKDKNKCIERIKQFGGDNNLSKNGDCN
jgi:hypothetical protein